MSDSVRKTGIDIIGDVQWGTHFCQFYQTKKDLLDILAPYFRAGLENNEFCMLVTSDIITPGEAIEAMREAIPYFDFYLSYRQMEIIPHNQWYLIDGLFNSQRVLDGWGRKYAMAIAEGFAGIRASGDTSWLDGEYWQDFCAYEQAADSIIGNQKILALCTYRLDNCSPAEAINAASNHKFAIIREDRVWERIENTDRLRAEKELRESEQRFRAIFDSSNDGIVAADIESKQFLFGNPMICRMLGCREDELKGLSVMDIHPAEDLTRVFEEFERQVKREVAIAPNLPVKRRNGTIFYADVSAAPVRLDGKKYLIGTFRDVTERRSSEEAVLKHNKELTSLNKEVERQREQLRAFALRLAEAQENERKRLSQELHDDVGQTLTALSINLNIALSHIDDETGATLKTRISDSLALADQITGRIRNIMTDLRPPELDDYGLFSALKWYAEMFTSRTAINVRVHGREIAPRPAAEIENSIFRIVQEALNNVVKHARATHVAIAIEPGDGILHISVADNGSGFDTSQHSGPNKWGLITMTERAMSIGGQLHIESAPGRSTTVIVEAPF
jgi:PAS domain S-box-containing protein